jgi:peptidoglycan/LPS O-acetylase OafA/YrhL
MSGSSSTTLSLSIPRRHDLDAVRAFAMLLGIALHAGLSFATFPWIVQDSRQNEAFTRFFQAIHGFRMPLFFLVSGFFTAMLWRLRGLRSLLKQRALRILLPLVLGGLTIIPAVNIVSYWAIMTTINRPQSQTDDGTLVAAVKKGDPELIKQRLALTADLNATDSKFGVTPLDWAALRGDVETLQLLIDHGADVNARNKDGSTALHGAAFLGRTSAVKLLLEKGADAGAKDVRNEPPLEAVNADWGLTRFIASLLDLDVSDKSAIEQGRHEVASLLGQRVSEPATSTENSHESLADRADGVRDAYQAAITSDRLSFRVGEWTFHLIQTPVFAHLWFLWFLCWLIAIFAAFAWASDRFGWGKPPRILILSSLRFLWLIPLTLVPQFFMGPGAPSFGPDTSESLVPMPHLLLYYGIFFTFGAMYFDADDEGGRLGRWWWLLLPCALLVALPVAVATMGYRPITSIAQVFYTWMMCCGVMGLFRKILKRENKTVRYVSDASYWLYLTHLPLILAAQVLVSDWPLPAILKFAMVTTVVTGALLVVYQTMVRYTWIGTMLNGRRTRPVRHGQQTARSPLGLETV